MRHELLPENLAEFRKRFGSFHDGIVHHLKLDLFSPERRINPYVATIVIGTQDLEQTGDSRWVNLTFEIVDITKLHLEKERDHDFSLIFELSVAFFDGEFYLDAFSYTHNPTSPADFEHGTGRTQFVIVGKRCFWDVSPYKEREIREW